MRSVDLCDIVLEALEIARPTAALAVLQPLLAQHLQATEVRLLMANYQLTALHPIHDRENSVAFSDTPAGSAFVDQEPVTRDVPEQGVEVYLPMSTRGDRMGVLQLLLPSHPDPTQLAELVSLARTIALSLRAASRQTDALERSGRTQRLTLAAELQWQLLPGRGCRAPEYNIAGHLEPAYHVHADAFDWSQDDDHLTLTLVDGSNGEGVHALLSTLTLTALRNARRAGLSIADQALLADQAVYAHHQGNQCVSALLLRIDLSTGLADVVLAGSPRLLILRDGQVYEPRLTEQVPLGMFEDNDYVEQYLAFAHGDRVLMVSDGVHDARSTGSDRFGDVRLSDLMSATAQGSAEQVVRRVVDELYEHRGENDLDDDAVVLCLDWSGPGSALAGAESTSRESPVELAAWGPKLRAVTSR
ncbi:MAG: PP2C family protein-serine/threonine phosphatase [Allobranchiibius sp.]